MSTDDGKRLAQLHDAMQDRIRELEEALRELLGCVDFESDRHPPASHHYARYVLAKAGPR
jgi:hypothetical protein